MANETIYVNPNNLSEFASKLTNKYKEGIFATKSQAGSPIPITDPADLDSIANEMDATHTYVYLGESTADYTYGHLYYLINNNLTDGGVTVAANPNLSGAEDNLSSIEIYGVKYAIRDTVEVNDATLDIQANGVSLGTFTANDNTDVTINITPNSLGISTPMDFIGVSSTDPKVSGATVSGHTVWSPGEVVIYQRTGESGYEEYVNTDGNNTGASWELLGDADSYAFKTIQIEAGTGLIGGGDLSQNRTLSADILTSSETDWILNGGANIVIISTNGTTTGNRKIAFEPVTLFITANEGYVLPQSVFVAGTTYGYLRLGDAYGTLTLYAPSSAVNTIAVTVVCEVAQ